MKTFVLFFVLCFSVYAQSPNEWEILSSSGNSILYLSKTSLDSFKGSDVYVWVLEKHIPPIVIESVDGRIHKTKTYYLFSKEYKRYSMLSIIYYDENDNVLKSFDYNRKTDIPAYKYNYPLMRGSNEEIIYQRIMELTGELKKDTE